MGSGLLRRRGDPVSTEHPALPPFCSAFIFFRTSGSILILLHLAGSSAGVSGTRAVKRNVT